MAIGFFVFAHLGDGDPVMVLSSAVLAIVAGAALEGGLVGYAQARVLTDACSGLRMRWWILATIAGAGTAWLLGMVPSTAIALTGPPSTTEPVQGPSGWIAIGLAAGLGLVLGPVLSMPQVIAFRHAGIRAWSWIPANAVAWAVGMPIVFAGAGAVPRDAGIPLIIGIVLLTCLMAGTAVGIVHGAWLIRIVRPERTFTKGR